MTENSFSVLPSVAIIKISEGLDKSDLYAFLEVSPNSEQYLVNSNVGFLVQDSLKTGQIRSLPLRGMKFLDDRQIFLDTKKDDQENSQPGSGSDLKHPLLAKMMVIRGTASQTDLARMIQEPINLKILRIDLQTLDKISFVNYTLNFQSLKELSIFAPNIGYEVIDKDVKNVGLILVNINSILGRANYPQLERLGLDLPFALNHEKSLMSAILRVLTHHQTTLKKLLINIRGNWEIPGPEGLGLNENPPEVIGLNLSEFNVRCQNKSPETFLTFHNILSQQTALQEIYFDTLDYPPLPIQLISENASTLTTIEMDISLTEIGGFIDSTVFSACIGLKILTLISNPAVHKKAKADKTDVTPEFLKTKFLPPTIQSLRLCHLYIHKEEIDTMAQNLKALKLIEFQDIGEDKDFGMTIQALNVFKADTNVRRITVCHGFNRESRRTIHHDGLNWLAERVNNSLAPSSPLPATSCVTFYLRQGVYTVARGSRDMSLYLEDNIGFEVKAYKLQYPFGPFPLDAEDYEKKGDVVKGGDGDDGKDSDEESDNEEENEDEDQENGDDEANGNENNEGAEGDEDDDEENGDGDEDGEDDDADTDEDDDGSAD